MIFGSCTTLRDAEEFIEYKAMEGWQVILRPFPFDFTPIKVVSDSGTAIGKVTVPSEWAFMLHRFHL